MPGIYAFMPEQALCRNHPASSGHGLSLRLQGLLLCIKARMVSYCLVAFDSAKEEIPATLKYKRISGAICLKVRNI